MQVKTTSPLRSVVFHVGQPEAAPKAFLPPCVVLELAGCSLFSGKKKKKKKQKQRKHSTSPSCFVCLAFCVPFAACSLVAQGGEMPSFKSRPELAPAGPRTRGKARGEGRGEGQRFPADFFPFAASPKNLRGFPWLNQGTATSQRLRLFLGTVQRSQVGCEAGRSPRAPNFFLF